MINGKRNNCRADFKSFVKNLSLNARISIVLLLISLKVKVIVELLLETIGKDLDD